MNLLVGRDRDTREPGCRRELRGSEQQPRLADARLPLERDGGEAAGGLAQLLGDPFQLCTAPDDRAVRLAQLYRERTLGPDEGVECTAVCHSELPALLIGNGSPGIREYDGSVLNPRSREVASIRTTRD